MQLFLAMIQINKLNTCDPGMVVRNSMNLSFFLNFFVKFHVINWEPQHDYVITRFVKRDCIVEYGPRREKTCLRGLGNNKGADQPVHPHRLISTFVFGVLESIIFKHATSEIEIF